VTDEFFVFLCGFRVHLVVVVVIIIDAGRSSYGWV
jgi:hypothetical protein